MAVSPWLKPAVLTASLAGLSLVQPLYGQDYGPPAGYYDSVEGLLGDSLKTALHEIIDGHTVLDYSSLQAAVRVLDADPDNPDNIILLYSGQSVPGHLFNSAWNREHVWPQSYGADAATPAGSDFHHLFPANPQVNSDRSNLLFDWTDPGNTIQVPFAPGSTRDSNSFEPRDEDKGSVARAMLYMDLRYDTGYPYGDFILAETSNAGTQQMAKLSTLLEWNRLFPPDEMEKRRNDLIFDGFTFAVFTYKQGNRNPFVDLPDLADAVFTVDDRIAWGTWRWQHFTMEQLANEDGVDELDDPDGDLLVNLLEYSANLDPNVVTQPNLLTQFRFPGFSIQLRYSRQKGYSGEGMEYTIEKSFTPLREESWMPLGEDEITGISVSATGDLELVTTNIKDQPQPVYFRLKVSRATGGEMAEARFDPVRSYDEKGSIFIYDSKVNGTEWRLSSWMDYLVDDSYPWIYHNEHAWTYLSATRDDSVWAYDSSIGWYFTSSMLYPYLYHTNSAQWLYFQRGSIYPERWFINASGGWLAESAL